MMDWPLTVFLSLGTKSPVFPGTAIGTNSLTGLLFSVGSIRLDMIDRPLFCRCGFVSRERVIMLQLMIPNAVGASVALPYKTARKPRVVCIKYVVTIRASPWQARIPRNRVQRPLSATPLPSQGLLTREMSTFVGLDRASIETPIWLMRAHGNARWTSSVPAQLHGLIQPATRTTRVTPWAVSTPSSVTSPPCVLVRLYLAGLRSQRTWLSMPTFTTTVRDLSLPAWPVPSQLTQSVIEYAENKDESQVSNIQLLCFWG